MRHARRRGELSLGPTPWIAAHRGTLPHLENTIPSLVAAGRCGADLVELDVQLAGDGTLVVVHDFDLGRLGGRPDLRVESTSAAELGALRLRDPESGARGSIPTLAAILAALPDALPVNLELKRDAADREAFLAALSPHLSRGNLLLSSFDRELLRELRESAPAAALAPLAAGWSDALAALADELEAWSVHVGRDGFAAPAARRAGRPVLVYTVDDPELAAQLFAAGAAGCFSDRPAALRSALAGARPPRGGGGASRR